MITRENINKNIRFEDVGYNTGSKSPKVYDCDRLSTEIDVLKNLLQDRYDCLPGQTVLIGLQPGISQIALIFACCELGLPITIIDYHRKDNFKGYKYTDPKTEILLPINFFIVSKKESTDKFDFFHKVCEKTIILDKHTNDRNTKENRVILANNDSLFIRCTSSGTTGTPKIVEHTHGFMELLIKRNTSFFDGKIGLIFNLNHGSSLATYFMPALFSTSVKNFINFDIKHNLLVSLGKYELSHLMIPYPHLIENFFAANGRKNDNLKIYTLSTIRKEWKKSIKNGIINDVISFFGSNETSGPIFVSSAKEKGFKENHFKLIDDFYKINVSENNDFSVTLPVYNKSINTNDRFKQVGIKYEHLGRNDIIRINGFPINLDNYRDTCKLIANCDLVYDILNNRIYLAIWSDHPDPKDIKDKINSELRKYSQNNHFISKFSVLEYEEFLSGVKLDQELLRDYFRKL